MKTIRFIRSALVLLACCGLVTACPEGDPPREDLGAGSDADSGPTCTSGTDKDNDGYGQGCAAGLDCNDNDPLVHPGVAEVCDGRDNNCDGNVDEGVLNACGQCTGACNAGGTGSDPFDLDDTTKFPDKDGIDTNDDGDIILKPNEVDFNFMWIANTDDLTVGTVSKIDTINLKEVGRYYTVTCTTTAGPTGCEDVNGQSIKLDDEHKPSRTAVDFNFDVWVANRAFRKQASATKVANDPSDCIDRNQNSTIETSGDRNGDGKIELDCDNDGNPDDASTTCTGAFAGLAPEFYGHDDECVLLTVNFGDVGDVGRSVCLGRGVDPGVTDAWVGTWGRTVNRYFRIDGKTGALTGPGSFR